MGWSPSHFAKTLAGEANALRYTNLRKRYLLGHLIVPEVTVMRGKFAPESELEDFTWHSHYGEAAAATGKKKTAKEKTATGTAKIDVKIAGLALRPDDETPVTIKPN